MQPEWHDLYTAEELAAAVELHAAQFAKKYGAYDVAAELRQAAACIRDLSERCELGAAAAARLQDQVAAIERRARASLESLSKLP